MFNKVRIIGGVVFVIVAGVAGLLSNMSANTYNEWANAVRPILVQQDALLSEVDSTAMTAMSVAIPGFLQRSLALQAQLQSIAPDDEEIAALHQHMVTRSVSIHSGLGVVQQAVNNNDQNLLQGAHQHFTQAGAHLQAFTTARQAYLDRHDLHLE